jgi:hypothetical protein
VGCDASIIIIIIIIILIIIIIIIPPYKSKTSWETQVKVDGPGGGGSEEVEEDLKRMRITGWRVKVEDRQDWSRIVEQTKTHPGL